MVESNIKRRTDLIIFPGMLEACLLVMSLLPFLRLKNWGLGRPLNGGLCPRLKGAPPLLGGLDRNGGLPGLPGRNRVELGDEPLFGKNYE